MPIDPNARCPACLNRPHEQAGEKDSYDLLRCKSCRTVYVSPMPTAADLAAIYDGYARTAGYEAKRAKKTVRARNRIRRVTRSSERHGRFLDVGCNAGFTVAAALDLGFDAHGIDIDGAAVECAREAVDTGRFHTVTIQGHAASGAQSDFIYMSEVIEHVPDPDGFVAALARILSPGGKLFLTTPAIDHPRTPRVLERWHEVKPPIHLVYFSREGLRRLFARHGFKQVNFLFHWKPGHRMTAVKR